MKGKSAPEHSLLKLYGSETLQQALLFGARVARPGGLDLDVLGPADVARGLVGDPVPAQSSPATIPGGTSEIQRNIIAERVLGLPR